MDTLITKKGYNEFNKKNVYTVSVTVAALANFGLNLFLIKKYGALGAAISSIIAEFIGCSIQIGYCCIKKQLKLSRIFSGFLRYFISGFSMFVMLIAIKRIAGNGIVGLLIIILSGIAFYFISLFVFRDELVIEGIKFIQSKLSIKKRKENC